MKALIIGAGGFVGSYLITELSENRGWSVCATKLPTESIHIESACDIFDLDILSEGDISEPIAKTRPDCIFHLAAQSSVAVAWEKPALTVDINVKGCVNLLEAVRKSGTKPRVILIGSSEEYGYAAAEQAYLSENTVPKPGNIYALTKYTQNLIGQIYCKAYKMDIIAVRAFNHIGPGQSPQFVVSDFCKQAAEIELGLKEPVVCVGNLSAERDFTDVRDIVRAYAEISLKGKCGETYNVGSGKAVSIEKILKIILSLSSKGIQVVIDKNRFRPVDTPKIEADIFGLTTDTAWLPQIELKDSVSDIFEYWRSELSGKERTL